MVRITITQNRKTNLPEVILTENSRVDEFARWMTELVKYPSKYRVECISTCICDENMSMVLKTQENIAVAYTASCENPPAKVHFYLGLLQAACFSPSMVQMEEGEG